MISHFVYHVHAHWMVTLTVSHDKWFYLMGGVLVYVNIFFKKADIPAILAIAISHLIELPIMTMTRAGV